MPPSALVAALAIGVSLGLLGGGGSILTVPALVYWAGLPPFQATSSSLVVVGLTSVSGAVQHAMRGNLRLRAALLIAATGVPAAYVGSLLSRSIPESRLMLLFGCVMVAAGLLMAFRREYQPGGEASLARILVAGVAVGLITGFFGIGGGFLVVPTLVLFAKVPMADAVGTSLAVIAFNCLAGFFGRIGSAGSIRWAGTILFSAVAIAGSFIGAGLVHRISSQWLRRGFAVFVLAVAVFIIAKQTGA
jgi:uncharacterized membrane protein YfcA